MRRPTGIQTKSSILGSATYISEKFGHKQFLQPTADSSRYWRKYGHKSLVNRSGSLLRNSMDMLVDLI